MLIKPIKLYRPRRRPAGRAGQMPAPVVPPTLVAVAIDYENSVELTFDRAIDVAGVDPAELSVDDASVGWSYVGAAPVTLVNPTTVRVTLQEAGDSTGPDTRMTVTAGNGIVALGDGGTWTGVSDVVIPFG